MAEITNAQRLLIVGAEQTANKGVADGYASLGNDGLVPASQLPAAASTTKDNNYRRQVGTTLECWYSPQAEVPTAYTTVAVDGAMWAAPFVCTRGGTIDRIAFEVTTLGSGSARCGIYTATSDTNLAPSALLVDSGDLSITGTGVKSATISQALTANTLYWFVFLGNSSGSVRAHAGTSLRPVLGSPSTLGANSNVAIVKGQSYGALPDPFPSITAGSNFWSQNSGAVPAVWVRFSA